MATISATLRTVPGTEAAEGTAGGHHVRVDRPDGVAGGTGSGLNGGQLLALAVGGCLCNDLRYRAHATGTPLGGLAVAVDVDLQDGRVTGLRVRVAGAPDAAFLAEAVAGSTVVAALVGGVPVEVVPVAVDPSAGELGDPGGPAVSP